MTSVVRNDARHVTDTDELEESDDIHWHNRRQFVVTLPQLKFLENEEKPIKIETAGEKHRKTLPVGAAGLGITGTLNGGDDFTLSHEKWIAWRKKNPPMSFSELADESRKPIYKSYGKWKPRRGGAMEIAERPDKMTAALELKRARSRASMRKKRGTLPDAVKRI